MFSSYLSTFCKKQTNKYLATKMTTKMQWTGAFRKSPSTATLGSCKIHGGGGVAASGRIQLNEFSNRSKARRFAPFGARRDSRSAGFNQILTRSLSFTTFVKLCLSVSQLFSKLLLDHAIRSFSAFITSSSPRDFWPHRTVLGKIRRSYLYSRLPRQPVEN